MDMHLTSVFKRAVHLSTLAVKPFNSMSHPFLKLKRSVMKGS